ncbi:hypothetical protein CVT26_010841 [Gymnopilus dilepis]|uniref:WAP domain-containing protein n=1 Tax=Gymnopilus dilepis TaxID=231916 RepID=A0A409VY16_9AGAR|nr:hypothetical protein CVT26_010841 [Gymnopilus dilepis]
MHLLLPLVPVLLFLLNAFVIPAAAAPPQQQITMDTESSCTPGIGGCIPNPDPGAPIGCSSSSSSSRFGFNSAGLEGDCTDVPPGCAWEETGPACAEECRVGHERERDLCDGSCCFRILCCED